MVASTSKEASRDFPQHDDLTRLWFKIANTEPPTDKIRAIIPKIPDVFVSIL